jgi:hypothetical protein
VDGPAKLGFGAGGFLVIIPGFKYQVGGPMGINMFYLLAGYRSAQGSVQNIINNPIHACQL